MFFHGQRTSHIANFVKFDMKWPIRQPCFELLSMVEYSFWNTTDTN